jgi:hypothetical protein
MNNAEIIIAITNTSIALIALALSIWSSHATRKHNRLSVRPFLNYFAKSTWDGKYAGICIRNNGLGPARIIEIHVFIDQQRVVNSRQVGVWNYVVEKLNLNKDWIYVEYIELGAIIRSEQELWFVSADVRKIPENEKDKFLEAISRLSFSIVYESTYKEQDQIGINVKAALTPWSRKNVENQSMGHQDKAEEIKIKN